MNLLSLIKETLSIVSTATAKDNEINMLISAAKADLQRQGINVDDTNTLTQCAIAMFVKGNFGNVDIKEKELAQRTYSLLCTNLGLSSNWDDLEEDEDEDTPTPEPTPEPEEEG